MSGPNEFMHMLSELRKMCGEASDPNDITHLCGVEVFDEEKEFKINNSFYGTAGWYPEMPCGWSTEL